MLVTAQRHVAMEGVGMAFLDPNRFPVATIFFQLSDKGRKAIIKINQTEGTGAAAAEMSALFVEEGIAKIIADTYGKKTRH